MLNPASTIADRRGGNRPREAMLRTLTRLRSLYRFLSSPNPNPPPSLLANPIGSILPPFSLLSFPFSSRRKKSAAGDDSDSGDAISILNRDPESPPKLFVVQPRLRPDSLLDSKLAEALNLANSLEEQRDGFFAEDFESKAPPPHVVVQNPAARSVKAHSDTYFGPGTVEHIKCHLNALESKGELDAVFVNAILSGIQQRNLEMAWGKPVLDRVGLIIEIFNAHAETKEAKLQSELAALMYMKSRLVRVRGPGGRLTFGTSGETEVVSARGRGSGGRGFISGAGETELQLQRRRIQERRTKLLTQIEEVRRTRALQRASRKRHGGSNGEGLATVAVVGYTNAGKSTLVSALSETDLYSDDRLFATVDPRLRSVILPSGRKALLGDTVGFISDLPIQLVEAFHATLEEVVEADLLVHVLDSSAPNLDDHRSTVLEVLQQIGVPEEKIQNMIEVWNKIDLVEEGIAFDESFDEDEWLSECEEEEDGTSLEWTDEEDGTSLEGEEEEEENRISLEGAEEEEEDGTFLEGEDDLTAKLSLSKPGIEDDISSELSLEEYLENSEDQVDDSLEELKMMDDEQAEFLEEQEMDDDLKAEFLEPQQMTDDLKAESLEEQQRRDDLQTESLQELQVTDLVAPCEPENGPHVKASAVMGFGLQELLKLIDEKLNAQTMSGQSSIGPVDRKWRPSYTEDVEKAAEQ